MTQAQTAPPARERLDKWLWAARFFKTRALAQSAVTGGHAQVGGQRVKPAHRVGAGDRLSIRKGPYLFEVIVRDVAAKRLSAPLARELYEETPDSVTRRTEQAEQRRAERETRPDFGARPDKRDRRQRMKFTGRTAD